MQYNFLNQLMQLYGIGQPLTNQMLKFSGNQFGPQEFEQPQLGNGFAPQPTVPPMQTQPNQPAFQTPQVPQAPVAQTPFQPQAPTTNTLSPEGHFKTVSPNFQMPNFGPKMSGGFGDFGGKATGPNSGFYRGGTGG